MLDFIKKTLRSAWLWILGAFALLVAVVVYLFSRAASANARAVVAAQRARVEIRLYNARKGAEFREKAGIEAAEAEHAEKLEALHVRAREIKEAAEDSRAALAMAINRSFGR